MELNVNLITNSLMECYVKENYIYMAMYTLKKSHFK